MVVDVVALVAKAPGRCLSLTSLSEEARAEVAGLVAARRLVLLTPGIVAAMREGKKEEREGEEKVKEVKEVKRVMLLSPAALRRRQHAVRMKQPRVSAVPRTAFVSPMAKENLGKSKTCPLGTRLAALEEELRQLRRAAGGRRHVVGLSRANSEDTAERMARWLAAGREACEALADVLRRRTPGVSTPLALVLANLSIAHETLGYDAEAEWWT